MATGRGSGRGQWGDKEVGNKKERWEGGNGREGCRGGQCGGGQSGRDGRGKDGWMNSVLCYFLHCQG